MRLSRQKIVSLVLSTGTKINAQQMFVDRWSDFWASVTASEEMPCSIN